MENVRPWGLMISLMVLDSRKVDLVYTFWRGSFNYRKGPEYPNWGIVVLAQLV